MDKDEFGLTEKHREFCEVYLVNNNAGHSYRMVFDPTGERGLTDGSCYSSGSRLLKKEKVKKYLDHIRGQIKTENLLTANEILYEITQLAKNPNVKPAIRLKALELLGRKENLFNENNTSDTKIKINLIGMGEEQDRIIIDHEEAKLLENSE
jgi:phage terminase small subunit